MATEARDGIETLTKFLDERGIAHETVEHEQTYSATEEAKAAGVAPDHAAKTVLLRDGDAYRMAVIPASHRLDLPKARDALGASAKLRLATEEEMGADFTDFDVGALPPFGPLLPAPEVVDRRLLEHERILCTGGDHRHSVLLDPNEVVRAADATLADVCED
ncbi:MAG TPA: YbaK/EbsC family protein [Solirubrobacterales bacterium]|nr:YbaK/EbsC family protein [Solirubrobacterales bacterium]